MFKHNLAFPVGHWCMANCMACHMRSLKTVSSPICWSATAERTAAETEYIFPVGFLRGWPVGVELVAGLPERPGSQQRHFLQAPKDAFVCSVLIYVQRIRRFTTMRYINLRFTYLLTYLQCGNCHSCPLSYRAADYWARTSFLFLVFRSTASVEG